MISDTLFRQMKFAGKYLSLIASFGLLALSVTGQVKKAPRPVKTTPTPTAAEPQPSPTPVSPKKNERPSDNGQQKAISDKGYKPTYFYEFTRPGFITSHILIEHDANGKGKMSYEKQDLGGTLTDDFQLTAATMKNINDALNRLNFLDSTENYQYEKDFSNLGNIVFRLVRDGRERSVKYNWTTNKDARSLMDEYRKISTEVEWRAEFEMSRQNQPLESPRLLDALDTYLRLGEISDPPHLIPMLKEISNDERLPLITRNHATRLIARIEKPTK